MGQPSQTAGTAAAVQQLQTSAGRWRCEGITPGTVAATAGLFKGFIMASARSIHIGSENIYPLWNG